jgi:hypothetical protein
MDALSITGCWEGARLSDQGGMALPFTLQQPPRALSLTSGPQVRIGTHDAAATRLLDGAARAFVALVDEARDPVSGRLAQLLLDARVRGDRLVGQWFRRDDQGHIVDSGMVEAGRVTTLSTEY